MIDRTRSESANVADAFGGGGARRLLPLDLRHVERVVRVGRGHVLGLDLIRGITLADVQEPAPANGMEPGSVILTVWTDAPILEAVRDATADHCPAGVLVVSRVLPTTAGVRLRGWYRWARWIVRYRLARLFRPLLAVTGRLGRS